ncbi:hypothetical protein ACFQ7G_17020 [Streptomyces massasporeus]
MENIGMAWLAVVQRVPTRRAARPGRPGRGSRAIPAYARSGFEESPRLLQARITRT